MFVGIRPGRNAIRQKHSVDSIALRDVLGNGSTAA
jgi:hypothetical protein